MSRMKSILSIIGKTLISALIIAFMVIAIKNFPLLSKKVMETYQKMKITSHTVHAMQSDIQNSLHINEEYEQIQNQYRKETQNVPKLQDFQPFLDTFLMQVKNQGLIIHNTTIQPPVSSDYNMLIKVEMTLSGSYDQFLSLLKLISENRTLIYTQHWTLKRTMAPATTVLSNDENKNNAPDQLNMEVMFEFVVLKEWK